NGTVEENISKKCLFLFGRTDLLNQDLCQATLYGIEASDHVDHIFSVGERIEIWRVFPFCLWFHPLRGTKLSHGLAGSKWHQTVSRNGTQAASFAVRQSIRILVRSCEAGKGRFNLAIKGR